MLALIRDMSKQIKLKTVILENFIPVEEQEKLAQRSFWDDDKHEWILHPIDTNTLNEYEN